MIRSGPNRWGRCVSAGTLIGSSAVMRKTWRLINRVVHSPYTVLLLGETGTAKKSWRAPFMTAALAVPSPSSCRTAPLSRKTCLKASCSVIAKAFTGAEHRDRPGLFDAAHGGTLLLDEIGDMPLSLQAATACAARGRNPLVRAQ